MLEKQIKVSSCCYGKDYKIVYSHNDKGSTGHFHCNECGNHCDEEYIPKSVFEDTKEAKSFYKQHFSSN